VQEHLEKLHTCTKAIYYICGLSEMVLDVRKKLIEAGVPQKRIHVELYG
jgi:ferredoxin-NADP reductase